MRRPIRGDNTAPWTSRTSRVRTRRIEAGTLHPRAPARPHGDRPMAQVKIGALCWNQYTEWPALLEAGVRADELGYDTLWTWDHLYPIVGDSTGPELRGLADAGRLGPGHQADPDRAHGRREHLPGARAHGQDGDDARPHQQRPRDPRHRRGVVRGGARGLRVRVRVRVPGAPALAGRGPADHARDARRDGAHGRGSPLPLAGHAQPARPRSRPTCRSASAAAARRSPSSWSRSTAT